MCYQTVTGDIKTEAYNKWKHNNPSFQVGDSVWLETTNLVTDEPQKLTSKCHSLFWIKDKLSDLTYQLKLPTQWKIHDVFHVNVLSKAIPNTILNHMNPAPPPIKVNNEDFWVIEKYLESQWFCNQF